ncbi:MAG: hypothetical protein KDJ50_04170 [Alphaproteobacteria bacterium]|nr:hypothetical protein [Alphaproteobacteria bacterium]
MDSNVFKALLAMDAYNRGYAEGITLPSVVNSTEIGKALIVSQSDTDSSSEPVQAGFYGIAYQLDGGETIVSYRGTDQAPDLFAALQSGDLSKLLTADVMNGYGLGAGSPTTMAKQAELAINFYHDVVGNEADWRSANVSFTGHSLGGGLAGFVGALYNRTGILFNNMAYQEAADNAYLYSTDHTELVYDIYQENFILEDIPANTSLKELVYGSGAAVPANYLNINTISMDGDFLAINRSAQTGGKIEVNLGPDVSGLSGTQYHSMATMVMQLYANTTVESRDWEGASKYFWPLMYKNDFARDIGMTSNLVVGRDQTNGEYAGILRQILAYSAIDEGTLVFGNTGIRAFYDDANDLGRAIASGANPYLTANAEAISQAFVGFAGLLALNKIVSGSPDDTVLKGVLTENKTLSTNKTLDVDLSHDTWAVVLGEDQHSRLVTSKYVFEGIVNNIDDSEDHVLLNALYHQANENWDAVVTPEGAKVYINFEHFVFANRSSGQTYIDESFSSENGGIFFVGANDNGLRFLPKAA